MGRDLHVTVALQLDCVFPFYFLYMRRNVLTCFTFWLGLAWSGSWTGRSLIVLSNWAILFDQVFFFFFFSFHTWEKYQWMWSVILSREGIRKIFICPSFLRDFLCQVLLWLSKSVQRASAAFRYCFLSILTIISVNTLRFKKFIFKTPF